MTITHPAARPGRAVSTCLAVSIHKLEGRAGIAGERMPLGGPYLSSADIDVIRAWIQSGASNN